MTYFLEKNLKLPKITPIANNNTVILIFSFKSLLVLNKISNPTPVLTRSPAIIVAKLSTLERYSCVIITDDAQLGINPTNDAIIGPIIGVEFKICAKLSSPIKYIIIFKTKDIIKILR